jgi:glycopeptide antibiotics resistance protein
LITDKNDKINKIIMKIKNKLSISGFHSVNLILIIFYLYPGSIFGCYLYNDCYIELQITRDFIISSNHLYAFIVLSTLGIVAYQNTKKIKFIIVYLFFLSIILELFHLIIPNRGFEMSDLFGNIIGVILIIIIYKVKDKYV